MAGKRIDIRLYHGKRKRRVSAAAACLAACAWFAAGCGGGAADSQPVKEVRETRAGDGAQALEAGAPSKSRNSVIVVMSPNSEPAAGFDPVYGWGAGEHVHEPLIQSTLTVTKPDLTIGYDLATDIEVSEDGMAWTVSIRDDARFSDGERLTAEDVAFTYNLLRDSSSVNDFTMLKEARALDDTTVEFVMERPFSIWPYTMAITGIVPEHAYGPDYGSHPIGSGRYVLKRWDRGQQAILEANPDYYGDAPNMEQVTVLFMEEDAAFAAVLSGQADAAYTAASYADQEAAGYSLLACETVDNRGFNLPAIEAAARDELRRCGIDEPVRAELCHMYFNTREYEAGSLPAGDYDAVRVTIGAGAGKNWWCVIYPPICLGSAMAEGNPELEEIEHLNSEPLFKPKLAVVELFESLRNTDS